jgi:hypothetical protein
MCKRRSRRAGRAEQGVRRTTSSACREQRCVEEGTRGRHDAGAQHRGQGVRRCHQRNGGLRESVRKLSKDGSIAQWTLDAVTFLTYLLDVVQGIGSCVRRRRQDDLRIPQHAAHAPITSFARWRARLRGRHHRRRARDAHRLEHVVKEGMKDVGKAFFERLSEQTFGSKVRARVADLDAARRCRHEGEEEPHVQCRGRGEGLKKWEDLLKNISERTAALQAGGRPAGKADRGAEVRADILDQLRTGTLKLSRRRRTPGQAARGDARLGEEEGRRCARAQGDRRGDQGARGP